MKRSSYLQLTGAIALLSFALTISAQASGIGQQPWRPLKEVKSEDEMQNLPGSATIAMACAKCKSVMITSKREIYAGKPARGSKEVSMLVHQCPGCGGSMERKGGAKERIWAHTCTKCGDDSVFCCATSRGKPTAGMAK